MNIFENLGMIIIKNKSTPTDKISMSDINTELSTSGEISLSRPDVYALAGITEGNQISMSDLRGKSSITAPEDGIFDLTIGYEESEYTGDPHQYGYINYDYVGDLNYKGIYINDKIYEIRYIRAEFYDNPIFGNPSFYFDISPKNPIINIGDSMTVTIIETNQSFTGIASLGDTWFINIEDDILAQYIKDNVNKTVQLKIRLNVAV